MSAIISDIRDDLRNLNEVKTEIAKVKAELKGLNVKIDPEAIKILEQRLQSLEAQAARTREKVSESISDMIQEFQSERDAISLPDIDDSGIQNIKQSAENLSKVYDNLSESAEKSREKLSSFDDDHLDELKEELENYRDLAEQSVNAATAAYEKQGEYVEALVGQMSKLNEEYTEQLKNGEDTSENVKRFEKLAEELDKAEAEYGELGEKLKEAEGKADDAGKALSNFGKATSIGATALKAFKGALMSIGWGLVTAAIGFVVNKLYELAEAFFTESEEAKKARENLEELEKLQSTTFANTLRKTIVDYKKLQSEYGNLRSEHEKTEWLDENRSKIDKFGVAINDVIDAERFFREKTQDIIKSFILRAQAAAYAAKAAKMYEQAMSYNAGDEVDKDTYKKYGLGTGNFVNTDYGFFKDTYKLTEKGAAYMNELALEKVSDEVEHYIQKSADLEKDAEKQLGSLASKENKSQKERLKQERDNLQKKLDNLKIEEAAGKKGRDIKKKIAILDKQLEAYSSKKDISNAKAEEIRKKKQIEAEKKRIEAEEKMAGINSKQQMEQERAARDLWFSTREAEIKAMDEGTEKVLAQMKLDLEKELDQIERSYEDLRMKRVEEAKKLWDADPKKKGNNFYESAEFKAANKNTDAETENRDARKNAAEKEFARRERELRNGQIQAMRDYLKEYGSLEQQKYAITKEYDDKIDKESDASQKALLQKQKEHLLAELDMKQLQQSIDWEMVFDDLDRASTEALGGLRDKLRKMLNGGDANPEDAKVLSEKILEIENEIAERSSVWSSLIPALKDRERMTREVARAEEDAANAAVKSAEANVKLFSAQNAAKDAIKNATGKEVAIKDLGNVEFIEKLRSELDTATTAGKAADAALANLAVAAADAATAQKEYTSAQLVTKNKKDILAGMGGGLGGIMSGAVDAAGGGALGIMNVANQNIQSMKDLVETMGLSETDFGIAVNEFASGSQGFVDAVNALASGDIVGAVNGVLEGVAGYAKGFTTLFAGSGNEKEKEAEIERLARSNEILAKAIDGLSEKILKSDSTNKESIEAYRKAISAEKEWEANQRKAINARASEWTNTGYGFLGLGGKSSFNAKMSATWAGWSDFAKVLKQNGINKSVSKNNIWSLTPEEMKLLRDFAPTRWKELFNGDGHKNPEELVNEYIERAGMGEKLVSDLNEKLTGYRWEGFLDSYKSMLKDLTSDNKTFADNLEEMLSNAILESLVNDVYKERIMGIYKMVADAADENGDGGTDITEKEANAIRDANKKLADDMLADRQRLIDLGLIKVSKGYDDQSASQIGVDKITSEQADKGIGILTAIQIATEQMRNKMYESDGKIPVLTATADDLRAIQYNVRDIASETRDFVVSTYLEVREINAHQAKIEKAVVDMQPRVAEIERGIKELA